MISNGFKHEIKQTEGAVQTTKGIYLMTLPDDYNILKEIFLYAVLEEIFLMKIYGEPDLRGRVAIDIGASIGDSALYFASLGASKIYGLSCCAERYNMAEQNIMLNNMTKRIQVFREAANAKSLKKLTFDLALTNVFLKIDCEGCEYDLIRDTDEQLLNGLLI